MGIIDTFVITVVTVIIFCLLIYAVYKRYKYMPSPADRDKVLKSTLEDDPLFNQTLNPDQIRALHRLVTYSI
ncbi:virion protein [Penguinpox virus]|uniref:Virion protein n=1 Tax=Penguinpox virus TaxID=648998 RepID=A0A068EFH3_9POXV|nr:virion protein [Penguinpox virus]AID46916.1 virion protein [Penguinpox virus]